MPADLSMNNRSARDRAGFALREGWDSPPGAAQTMGDVPRTRRGLFALNRSPLARKIILSNLIALVLLVAGVMYLNPFRDSLVAQRQGALAVEAELIAGMLEASLSDPASGSSLGANDTDVQRLLTRLRLPTDVDVHIFALPATLVASSTGMSRSPPRSVRGPEIGQGDPLLLTDFLNAIWSTLSAPFTRAPALAATISDIELARALVTPAAEGVTVLHRQSDASGTLYAAASPMFSAAGPIGVVVVTTAAEEIDQLVRAEREQLLRMVVVALLVSIGLSLVLASTIAQPLADLTAAAELGRDKNTRKIDPSQVRIPDLTGRPDEIGRLSGALRGMVSALHDLIDKNEEFAADVSHEIKNPLASLRSAVGTLRLARTDDQRNRLLDVIEHDVQRMDRLVSDISNASRLDSELVKETEAEFDLVRTVRNIAQYHAQECEKKGVELITDLPGEPIHILGLEGRLAQVFVNLLSNAISFCEDGDAVRLWIRRRENRVLVVVEDTGPGIPQEALTKVFNRFYSERPAQQFGNHSGLGLAISKQIVEAHGGVIWAENINPADAGTDATSKPLGARFVVGLPI